MTTSYPIIAQHQLGDPVKRGTLGFGRRRDTSEIPKIKPHEVLVWRVGSSYIVDERQLQSADDTVVRASSVSVVSVRPSTEVEVAFQVDSEDSLKFDVKVIFICSVLDPVAVVRDGQVDAADALLAYLRGYQDLFAVGLEHPIKEVNKVRVEMAIQIKSYMALRPPKIPGIDVASATVQVETPPVLSQLKALSTEQQIELEKERGEARIDAERQNHILAKTAKLNETIGSDPVAAIDMAYADKAITAQVRAEQLAQINEANEHRKQVEELAARTRQYAVADRDAEWEHDEKRTQIDWAHAQIETQRKEDREDRGDQVKANLELLKLLAEHGHLDTYNADLEDLIRRIRGDRPGSEVTAAEQHPQLTDGHAGASPGRDSDSGS